MEEGVIKEDSQERYKKGVHTKQLGGVSVAVAIVFVKR